jgi:hypothetical protein
MAGEGLASGGRASEHENKLTPTAAAAMTATTFRN